MNSDGSLDTVTSAGAGSGVAAWTGSDGAAWTSCPITQTLSAQSGDWKDLAIDYFDPYTRTLGVVAISLGGNGNGVRYFRQTGSDCSAWTETSLTNNGNFTSLAAGYINHDAYPDLIASAVETKGVRLWLGGPGGWTPANAPLFSKLIYDTVIGDFNHDGWNDIAAAGDAGSIHVLQNNSLASWTDHVLAANGTHRAIALGDLNHDGNLDLVLAANGGGNSGIDVWLGSGDFNFTQAASPTAAGQYNELSTGDLNHDGQLDILAASVADGLKVWLGDGAGGWTALNGYLPRTGAFLRAQFGDINRDGSLDILATAPGTGLQIWTASGKPFVQTFLPLVAR